MVRVAPLLLLKSSPHNQVCFTMVLTLERQQSLRDIFPTCLLCVWDFIQQSCGLLLLNPSYICLKHQGNSPEHQTFHNCSCRNVSNKTKILQTASLLATLKHSNNLKICLQLNKYEDSRKVCVWEDTNIQVSSTSLCKNLSNAGSCGSIRVCCTTTIKQVLQSTK